MIDRKSTLKQVNINALNCTRQTLLLYVAWSTRNKKVNDYNHSTVLATKRHQHRPTHTRLHREG